MADNQNTENNEESEMDEETESQTDDIAAMKAALKKANDEAKKYRLKVNELEPLAEAAKKAEDDKKSEVERLTEQVAALQKERDTATVARDRMQVALDKGLTPSQAKRLVGNNAEELAADADELLADLGALSEDVEETPKPAGKPQERLKPGSGDPDAPVEETDIKKLGERMFSN